MSNHLNEQQLFTAAKIACSELLEHIAGDVQFNDAELEARKSLIKDASLKSFYFFCKAVLGFDLLNKTTHKNWCDDIQKDFDQYDNLMRLKPRGTYKTTIYGEGLPLWLWVKYSTELRIFYTSANESLLSEVSAHLDYFIGLDSESLYSFVFGIKRDKKSRKNTNDVFNIIGRDEKAKGSSLMFRTAGGSTNGVHPHIIIIDDPCFVAGTPVLTSKGYKAIEKIKVGEYVLTRNGYKKVTWAGKTVDSAIVQSYIVNGKSITCTPTHGFITENRGKIPINEINETDSIIEYSEETGWKQSKPKIVKKLCSAEHANQNIHIASVYNITVDGEHEFIANGILVANCDKADRESKAVRNGKERWYDSLIPLLVPYKKRGMNICKKIIIATRWHLQDLINYIIEKSKNSPVESTKYSIEIESVYNDDGSVRFPEMLPETKLEAIKSEISEVFFACQYLNNPLPEGIRIFVKERLFFIRPEQYDIRQGTNYLFFDPSLGKTLSDFPASIFVNQNNGKIIIYDAIDEKIPIANLIPLLARKVMETLTRQIVFETNNTTLMLESLHNEFDRLQYNCMIDGIHETRNKEERISATQPELYNGSVFFRSDYETAYPELMNQVLFYPAWGYDDFPDVIEKALSWLMKNTVGSFVGSGGINTTAKTFAGSL